MEDRLRSYIAEWLTSLLPDVIRRDVTLPLDKDYVTTVTGRRSGKTFVLFQTIQDVISGGHASRDEVLYVDFEDYRLRGFGIEDLDKA